MPSDNHEPDRPVRPNQEQQMAEFAEARYLEVEKVLTKRDKHKKDRT